MTETDFTGRSVHYAYDAAGRCIRAHYPDNRVVCRHYSARDLLIMQQTWRSEEGCTTLAATVRYDYDAAGRLVRAENAEAVAESDYDAAGYLTAERLNGREIRHQWDPVKGMPCARESGGLALAFRYGIQGELTQFTLAGHEPLRFQYDRLNREVVRESAAGFIQACNYTAGLLANQAAGRNSAQFQQQLREPDSVLPALAGSAVSRSWQYDRAFNVAEVMGNPPIFNGGDK